jgi:cell fate (sporulation/competence/biofilm development) regulator YmcA (YheA/YmcA/DUF963 family)
MCDCSSCQIEPVALEYNHEIDQAAERLATLLAGTPEFQEFSRLAEKINADEDVKRILSSMRFNQMGYGGVSSEETLSKLQAELEALPVVQAYQKAGTEVCTLFRSVDAVISRQAGLPFAVNAKVTSCGGCSCGN